jgi:hypothetical protein
MGYFFESQGWFTHFTHPGPESAHLHRTQPGVVTERHLQFKDWFGCQAGDENVMESAKEVMMTFEGIDGCLHGHSRFDRLDKTA